MVADDVGEVREERLNALTWEREVTDIATPSHRERIAFLTENAGARIDETAYVAAAAQIYTSQLKLGAHSWIAGHALVRGDIEFGAHCTVNPYACISGKVRCGDGVRIASLASIIGFNHGFDDPDLPIHMQPHETVGITIADDVWIGANAVILDGVTIGRGAVVAAGAVVSRDIPEMTIAAGVPAKPVRQRGAANPPKSRRTQVQNALENIGRVAGAEWRDVLATNRQGDDYLSLEADGIARHSIRHLCDAIEIAAGFGSPPEGHAAQDAIARLQAVQDRVTGLFPDPFRPPAVGVALRSDDLALYNVLAVGYALETLGARPVHPVAAVEIDARDLCAWLEALPWTTNAWGAGAHVDAIGTGLYLNARHFTSNRARETLFGWLAMKIDRSLGLWGRQTQREGLLLPVNGFYRLTRGTYAQFGVPVPLPEAAINSVLTNYRNNSGFQEATYTACNLLDTIHPLWLCRKQTDHRRADSEAVAEDIILRAPSRWQLGKGFPFRDGQPGSLQGTEMWLSVLHLAADTLGIAELFPFTPKGVHRTSPVGLGL